MVDILDETQLAKITAFFGHGREIVLSRRYQAPQKLIWDDAMLVDFLCHIRSSTFMEPMAMHRPFDLEAAPRSVEQIPQELAKVFVNYSCCLMEAHLRELPEAKLNPLKIIMRTLEQSRVSELIVEEGFHIPVAALSLFTDQGLSVNPQEPEVFILEQSFEFKTPNPSWTPLPLAPALVCTLRSWIFPPTQRKAAHVGLNHQVPRLSKVNCSLVEFFCFMLILKQADALFNEINGKNVKEEQVRNQLRQLPDNVIELKQQQAELQRTLASVQAEIALLKEYLLTVNTNVGNIFTFLKKQSPAAKRV